MTYKVLIVDDSKLARMSVIKLLSGCHPDWPRLEAANAAEAVNVTRDDAPDIALLDFNMPVRDGLDLAAELRKLKPRMPIAVISANHQEGVVNRAKALGAAFLPKPLSEKAMSDFLESAVQDLKNGHSMTESPGIILNELELDALTELVNLGVSQAATSLALMVKDEVALSVPRVVLVGREEAIRILGEKESKKLVAVHQIFEGDITGRALLIFPEARSLELVRAVVGGELSLEEITELEQEALAETGNVILNGCLATMANILQRSLKISLPEIIHGESRDFFNLEPPPIGGAMVMFIYINFVVRQRNIDGYIALMMDMPSLESLQALLVEYIGRETGTPGS